MTFRLLSCDGGGIRGYMTTLILEKLDAEAGGKLIANVDGFAGTSTGGLISIALASGRKIAELEEIYRCRAPTIFRENESTLFEKISVWLLWLLGHSGGPGVFSSQYTAEGIREIATGLVHDRTLGDIAKDKVLAVNTAALSGAPSQAWLPFTLSNHDIGTGPGQNMLAVTLVDAAMATSAAPTYFPPHRIQASGTDFGYFADGGTFANNPVLNGIEIARAVNPDLRLEDIEVLSIGTGVEHMGVPPGDVGNPLNWGLLGWFGLGSKAPYAALLELTMTAAAENGARIAKAILPEQNVARLNPAPSKTIALDGYTQADYDVMRAAVAALTTPANPAWVKAAQIAKRWTGAG